MVTNVSTFPAFNFSLNFSSFDSNKFEEYYNHFEQKNRAVFYTFSTILSAIVLLSILFNSISVLSILMARAFTPINVLIVNLAFADLTYSLGIPMFISHTFSKSWPFGLFGCRFFIFTEFFGIIVGILTVTGLSVERFY